MEDTAPRTQELFEQFDKDGSGYLERNEVRKVAEKLFCPHGKRQVSEAELDHIMGVMDTSRDGKVDYQEFARWWTSLGWEVQKSEAAEAGLALPEPNEADLEDQKHEVTVVLSGIMRDSPSQPIVLYAFDVKVFGVTVYKFFDRYSRLRAVASDMEAAGCLEGFGVPFPRKQRFAGVAANEEAQAQRGNDLLQYYAGLFTDAKVMHHPDTKKFLGFSAEDIDIARAKRKEHLVKMLPPAPVIEIGSYVRIKHPFNEATYQEPDKWRAQDDLYLVVGDVVIVKGKVTHEEKELPDWFKGTKYSDEERGNTASKNFPATPHFVELIPDGEAQRLKDRLNKAAQAAIAAKRAAAAAPTRPVRNQKKQGGGCCASKPR